MSTLWRASHLRRFATRSDPLSAFVNTGTAARIPYYLDLRAFNQGRKFFKTKAEAEAERSRQISATDYAPPNDLESAILVTVPSGNYTAIVSGFEGGTGIGLVEVYKL